MLPMDFPEVGCIIKLVTGTKEGHMSNHKHHRNIYLAGVDLAWQSERNPTAIAFGVLDRSGLTVVTVEPAVNSSCNLQLDRF